MMSYNKGVGRIGLAILATVMVCSSLGLFNLCAATPDPTRTQVDVVILLIVPAVTRLPIVNARVEEAARAILSREGVLPPDPIPVDNMVVRRGRIRRLTPDGVNTLPRGCTATTGATSDSECQAIGLGQISFQCEASNQFVCCRIDRGNQVDSDSTGLCSRTAPTLAVVNATEVEPVVGNAANATEVEPAVGNAAQNVTALPNSLSVTTFEEDCGTFSFETTRTKKCMRSIITMIGDNLIEPELISTTLKESVVDKTFESSLATIGLLAEITLLSPEAFPINETETCEPIYDIVCETFGALCRMITIAGFQEELTTGENFTLFAPPNEVFSSTFEDYNVPFPYLNDEELLYHIIPGDVIQDFDCNATAIMGNGESADFLCDGDNVYIVGDGNDVTDLPLIVDVGIEACNGIVYVVNNVIQMGTIEEFQNETWSQNETLVTTTVSLLLAVPQETNLATIEQQIEEFVVSIFLNGGSEEDVLDFVSGSEVRRSVRRLEPFDESLPEFSVSVFSEDCDSLMIEISTGSKCLRAAITIEGSEEDDLESFSEAIEVSVENKTFEGFLAGQGVIAQTALPQAETSAPKVTLTDAPIVTLTDAPIVTLTNAPTITPTNPPTSPPTPFTDLCAPMGEDCAGCVAIPNCRFCREETSKGYCFNQNTELQKDRYCSGFTTTFAMVCNAPTQPPGQQIYVGGSGQTYTPPPTLPPTPVVTTAVPVAFDQNKATAGAYSLTQTRNAIIGGILSALLLFLV